MLVPLPANATAEQIKSSVKAVGYSKEDTIAHYNNKFLTALTKNPGYSEGVIRCNKWIRRANARLDSTTANIMPLYSIVTGEAIENFPKTGYHITQLSREECSRILRLLCMRCEGKINDLRWRIFMASGATFGHDKVQVPRIF